MPKRERPSSCLSSKEKTAESVFLKMRSWTTHLRSSFIRRVLLNTATCGPLPKIPGLSSYNPKVGAWDCVFDKLASDCMHILVWQPLSQWQGQGKRTLHSISLTYWAWSEKNLLFQIIAEFYNTRPRDHILVSIICMHIFPRISSRIRV